MRRLLPVTVLALSLGCQDAGTDRVAETAPPDDAAEPETSEEWSRRMLELYETAREKGDKIPGDAYEWARDDVQRIGDWEYLIVRLPGDEDDEVLAASLNELGKERWEAYWVEPRGDGLRVFLKRRARSYLQVIPFAELRRLVPGWGSDGGS